MASPKKPSPVVNPVGELFLTLIAYEEAKKALEYAAPKTVAELGGAQAIIDKFGGEMRPSSRCWWHVNLDAETWEKIATEHQAQFRGEYE